MHSSSSSSSSTTSSSAGQVPAESLGNITLRLFEELTKAPWEDTSTPEAKSISKIIDTRDSIEPEDYKWLYTVFQAGIKELLKRINSGRVENLVTPFTIATLRPDQERTCVFPYDATLEQGESCFSFTYYTQHSKCKFYNHLLPGAKDEKIYDASGTHRTILRDIFRCGIYHLQQACLSKSEYKSHDGFNLRKPLHSYPENFIIKTVFHNAFVSIDFLLKSMLRKQGFNVYDLHPSKSLDTISSDTFLVVNLADAIDNGWLFFESPESREHWRYQRRGLLQTDTFAFSRLVNSQETCFIGAPDVINRALTLIRNELAASYEKSLQSLHSTHSLFGILPLTSIILEYAERSPDPVLSTSLILNPDATAPRASRR